MATKTKAAVEKIGLHNLVPAPGSHRNRKRLGRGPGSGTGKTSGKGHKGIKARSGHHGTKDDRNHRPRRQDLPEHPHVDILDPTAGNGPKGSNSCLEGN